MVPNREARTPLFKLGYFSAMLQQVLWLNAARTETPSTCGSRHSVSPGEKHPASEGRTCAHQFRLLWTLVGIVEDSPTLETTNLAGPLAASGQDVINDPLVRAARVRGGPAGVSTGFLNHVVFHETSAAQSVEFSSPETC